MQVKTLNEREYSELTTLIAQRSELRRNHDRWKYHNRTASLNDKISKNRTYERAAKELDDKISQLTLRGQ